MLLYAYITLVISTSMKYPGDFIVLLFTERKLNKRNFLQNIKSNINLAEYLPQLIFRFFGKNCGL